MPPGGHVEPDEDPLQAVLREIREETGIAAAIIATRSEFTFSEPSSLPPPYTILIEDIPAGEREPAHQHIDLIYFCHPVPDDAPNPVADPTLRWVDEDELRSGLPLEVVSCGVSAAIPEDVGELALIAIKSSRHAL